MWANVLSVEESLRWGIAHKWGIDTQNAEYGEMRDTIEQHGTSVQKLFFETQELFEQLASMEVTE